MSCVTIMMPPIVMACSETQSQAPKKRTVICEMEPAASAMTEMPFSQRRFACLASSSSVLEARKRLSAGPSALKLLIWANPAIMSCTAATKRPISSETACWRGARRLPDTTETQSDSRAQTMAQVARGTLSTKSRTTAERNIGMSLARVSIFSRQVVSIVVMSFVKADS
jgi:hypothetical protein